MNRLLYVFFGGVPAVGSEHYDSEEHKNPFKRYEKGLVRIVEVREGWVKYQFPSGGTYSTTAFVFRSIYRPVTDTVLASATGAA